MSERMDRLMILLPDELLALIDQYRRESADLPPRTEAIRRLIRAGLKAPRALETSEAR